jgi:hypothetical protein
VSAAAAARGLGGKLKRITYTIPFDKVIDTAGEILAGKIRGRVVVEIG